VVRPTGANMRCCSDGGSRVRPSDKARMSSRECNRILSDPPNPWTYRAVVDRQRGAEWGDFRSARVVSIDRSVKGTNERR